jgi:precorrin-6A/cobalt-precorrin-6A reductase
LIAFLRDEGVTHLVDGTHPFATTMSRNARMACQVLDIPRMIFQRPAWRPQEGDRWYPVPDMAEARVRLPGIGHAPFLALGRGEAATLVDLPDQTPTLRLLPGNPPLAGCRIVEGRGPFTRAGELALLRALGVDCVVRKNSGGRSGYALLEAARILELPVLMVERPIGESGPVTDDPRTVARWIRDPTANTNP